MCAVVYITHTLTYTHSHTDTNAHSPHRAFIDQKFVKLCRRARARDERLSCVGRDGRNDSGTDGVVARPIHTKHTHKHARVRQERKTRTHTQTHTRVRLPGARLRVHLVVRHGVSVSAFALPQ